MTTETAVHLASPKTRWQRLDDIAGFLVFTTVIGGGIVGPFLFYLYALLFR